MCKQRGELSRDTFNKLYCCQYTIVGIQAHVSTLSSRTCACTSRSTSSSSKEQRTPGQSM